MSLTQGTRLGPYEVFGIVGAGGMGEVYRARDTKLQRDVAIKVLPDLFATDPGRLARFEREAQTLAALNHPNIAQIHGVLEHPPALVMEFVGGDDLQQRIAQGAVPVDDALPIARQIAEALEAAHDRGIVHRDLKPANIKIGPDGIVKVLDFGLARALEAGSDGATSPAANSPTFTSPAMTRAGVILGTAAYMAPEQARGKAVDRRADIWAFGCVLFEMLTGRLVFAGETVTDTLSGIISREPEWHLLPANTPPSVRQLLRRCLEKDPRRRLQAIGEARLVLETPGTAGRAELPPKPTRAITATLGTLLVLVGISAGVILAASLSRRPSASPRPAHLTLPIAPALGLAGGFTLSPNGSQLAFVGVSGGRSQIFIRSMDRDEATPVPGTEGVGTAGPVFSPDGRWLVFTAAGALKKIALVGGEVTTVSTVGGSANTRPAWLPDDTIVFTNTSLGLSRIPAAGGEPHVLTTPDSKLSEMSHEMPWFFSGTKFLLFDIRRSSASQNRGNTMIVAQSLDTGERRELFPGMVLGFMAPDRLVVGRDEAIVSIPFDSTRLIAKGEPEMLLTPPPAAQRLMFSNVPLFAVASNGTIVFQPARPAENDIPLMMVDRTGTAKSIRLPPHRYSDPRVSPGGDRVAVHVFEETRDNWIADLRRGTLTRLTFDPGEDETPVWSPDGKWVFWTATRTNLNRAIFRKAADGTGGEQLIWSGNAHAHIGGITPDAKTLVISLSQGVATHLYAITVADGRQMPLLATPFATNSPALSPDGKWLAYISDESGRDEVYVQPFPSMQGRTQVSAGGGAQPVWSRNGKELFYRGGGKIMAVPFTADGAFVPSSPQPLFDDRFFSTQGVGHTSYDVTPDGRFVMIGSPAAGEGAITHLTILYRP